MTGAPFPPAVLAALADWDAIRGKDEGIALMRLRALMVALDRWHEAHAAELEALTAARLPQPHRFGGPL